MCSKRTRSWGKTPQSFPLWWSEFPEQFGLLIGIIQYGVISIRSMGLSPKSSILFHTTYFLGGMFAHRERTLWTTYGQNFTGIACDLDESGSKKDEKIDRWSELPQRTLPVINSLLTDHIFYETLTKATRDGESVLEVDFHSLYAQSF